MLHTSAKNWKKKATSTKPKLSLIHVGKRRGVVLTNRMQSHTTNMYPTVSINTIIPVMEAKLLGPIPMPIVPHAKLTPMTTPAPCTPNGGTWSS